MTLQRVFRGFRTRNEVKRIQIQKKRDAVLFSLSQQFCRYRIYQWVCRKHAWRLLEANSTPDLRKLYIDIAVSTEKAIVVVQSFGRLVMARYKVIYLRTLRQIRRERKQRLAWERRQCLNRAALPQLGTILTWYCSVAAEATRIDKECSSEVGYIHLHFISFGLMCYLFFCIVIACYYYPIC